MFGCSHAFEESANDLVLRGRYGCCSLSEGTCEDEFTVLYFIAGFIRAKRCVELHCVRHFIYIKSCREFDANHFGKCCESRTMGCSRVASVSKSDFSALNDCGVEDQQPVLHDLAVLPSGEIDIQTKPSTNSIVCWFDLHYLRRRSTARNPPLNHLLVTSVGEGTKGTTLSYCCLAAACQAWQRQ